MTAPHVEVPPNEEATSLPRYLFEDQIIDLNDEVRQAELILDSNIYDINLIEPVIEQKYQLYRNINECLPDIFIYIFLFL